MVQPRPMATPSLVLLLPGGRRVEVGTEAVLGRSPRADVLVDDPRVSTVHAEVSWRGDGYCVLARGGRVVVDGLAVATASLQEGSRITLAPGVTLEVVELRPGDAPAVPRTAGEDRLDVRGDATRVELRTGDTPDPRLVLDGLPARLLVLVATAPAPVPWDEAAGALWPDEGALRAARGPLRTGAWTAIDERRHRNRFDQVLAALRAQLATVRPTPVVVLKRGVLVACWEPRDRVQLR